MLIANYCPTTEMMPLLGGKFCGTKRMSGFFLFERGVSFAPSFTKEDLDELVQQGKAVGFISPDSLADNNADATFSETNTLVRNQTKSGRKGWTFSFYKSNCFQNELNKLNNSENWAIAPVLEDGSIVLWKSKNGNFFPFNAKTFVSIYNQPILGGEDAGSTIEIDLVGSLDQWQNNGQTVAATDFEWNEVNPVAGLNIEVPVLVASATTTVVTIKNLCSSATVSGLTTPAKWKMYRNGVSESVSAVAENVANQTYTFTHAALVAADKIYFSTEEDGLPIYVLDSAYYTGQSATQIVA